MKEFLCGWVLIQLVVVGFIGGIAWREEIRHGCVQIEQSTEIHFVHYVLPMLFPMAMFVSDENITECE